MEDFKDIDEYNKYQTEWALVNLVRELRGISNRGASPTYYSAIKLATQIIPEVFNESSYIVQRHHEPELARSYRQQAEANSRIKGQEIQAIDILDERVKVLNEMIATEIDIKDVLQKELAKLHSIRPLFLPMNVKEDYILAHDVRSFKFGMTPINIQAKYSDYRVSEKRIIRVRLIHPDGGEQSLGADLIYEQYDPEKKKVRLVMVQYKIWKKELLYWSQAKNLQPQLVKMKENLCDKGYCFCELGNNQSAKFRYPHCSAFLRPTDKLQYKDSNLTSSGMHIPICRIDEVAVETGGNKTLKKSNMRETSLSHRVFEESFNYNQIGSRWLNYNEAEALYQEHGILENGENIILHVQELELM